MTTRTTASPRGAPRGCTTGVKKGPQIRAWRGLRSRTLGAGPPGRSPWPWPPFSADGGLSSGTPIAPAAASPGAPSPPESQGSGKCRKPGAVGGRLCLGIERRPGSKWLPSWTGTTLRGHGARTRRGPPRNGRGAGPRNLASRSPLLLPPRSLWTRSQQRPCNLLPPPLLLLLPRPPPRPPRPRPILKGSWRPRPPLQRPTLPPRCPGSRRDLRRMS
mmetsp:Transcript_10995/g.25765  ORF Transcript_10995/g.25765 Transcript_10995/m.25765 type:complete len:217 (-) Transcript_10995:2513-3163(-)